MKDATSSLRPGSSWRNLKTAESIGGTALSTKTKITRATRVRPAETSKRDGPETQPTAALLDKGPDAPRNEKVARAKKLLETVRCKDDTRLTFGGRVANTGINPADALKNYYTSMRVAQHLAGCPEFEQSIGEYIRDLSIPTDLRDLVPKALGFEPLASPRQAAPLGKAASVSDVDYVLAAKSGDLACFSMSDAALREVFVDRWWNSLEEVVDAGFSPEVVQAQVRVFARAAELGIMTEVPDASRWDELVDSLPTTESAAVDLLRLVQAFEVDPATVRWKSGTLAGRGVARVHIPKEPATELGNVSLSAAEANAALDACDIDKLEMNDESVLELYDSKALSRNFGFINQAMDKECADDRTRLAAFRVPVRAKELGAKNVAVADWESLANDLPHTREGAALLRRFGAAFGEPVEALRFGSAALEHFVPNARSTKTFDMGRPQAWTSPAGSKALSAKEIRQQLKATTPPEDWSDETINTMADIGLSPSDWPVKKNISIATERSRLAIISHGVEIGAFSELNVDGLVHRLSEKALRDPECADLLVNIALHRGFVAGRLLGCETSTPSRSLRREPEVAAALWRAQARPTGAAAPLPPEDLESKHHVPSQPLGKVKSPWMEELVEEKDKKLFKASDALLGEDAEFGHRDWAELFDRFDGDSGLLGVMARSCELSDYPHGEVEEFLSALPHAASTAPCVPFLVRAARAIGMRFDEVRFATPVNGVATLADHPGLAKYRIKEPPPAQVEKQLAQTYEKLDASKKVSPQESRQAIRDLVSGTKNLPKPSFQRLAEEGIARRADGTLAPIGAQLGPAAQRQLVQEVGRGLPHLGAMSVFLGLYTQLDRQEIQAALETLHYTPTQSKTWAGVASALSEMSGSELRAVLRSVARGEPSDFTALPQRIELTNTPLTPEALESAFQTRGRSDIHAFVGGILDAAAETPEGSSEREAVSAHIEKMLAREDISASELRRLLQPETLAILAADMDGTITKAVEACVKASPETQKQRLDELGRCILDQGQFTDPNAVARKALGQLHQADLTRVLPLAELDKELGGVAGVGIAGASRYPEGTETVFLGGLQVKLNDRKDKDKSAIPRKQNAELVMTETTQANVRRLAAAWRLGQPVLLEGPTSSGKTSAIRYMAHKTGSPYRRINLSYYTEVDDLLGRYVGGERQFDRAALEAKPQDELHAIGAEYGVEEGTPDAAMIDHVLAAQEEPRWVDGPVVRAMKKGEVLLLDEMNLARPEVLERLNSLFDDDGNIVLTEHANEVIDPDENFRLFATMNPATYSGRARLSDAMRSRWTNVYAHGLTQADLSTVLQTIYKDDIPKAELAKLIAVHDNLSRVADEGEIGRRAGGLAFTLRNLFKVCDRFLRYRETGLDDDALMRREVEELYMGGLFDEDDSTHVKDVLDTAMPYNGPNFYENLELKEDKESFTIGDVTVSKLNIDHALTPDDRSRLVMTSRTKQVLYRLAKALDMGENVGLMGERASGKTAMAKMFAGLRGQPYRRQNLHGSTDGMQLIGGYDNTGWRDGLLLEAARPDGTPGVFVGDEFNLASPALLERLNSVLDDERKLVLAERAPPEEIRLHPDFRFIAAMNPPTSSYGGRAKLSPAMQNRFTMVWVPDLEDPDEQKEILQPTGKKLGVSPAMVDTLVDLQVRIRSAYEADELGSQLREKDKPDHSIRSLFKAVRQVADTMSELGPAGSYLLAVESIYAASSEHADNEAIIKMAKEVAA